MSVCQTFITGQQGAGKTTLARHLVGFQGQRVVALDMLHDYPEIPGTESYGEFAETLEQVYPSPFKLAVRHREPSHHRAALRLVYRLQEERSRAGAEVPPIVLLMEETSLFAGGSSAQGQLPEVLRYISTKGRHFNLSYVAVVQRGTQVPPMLGTNADVVVALHTRRMDAVLKECFPRSERETIRELVKVEDDAELPMGEPPKLGRHFLTDPPETDVYTKFREATT